MRTIIGLLAVACFAAAIAAGYAGDAKAGQKSYDVECKECHQMNGAPVGSVAKSMLKQGVKMRDLKAPEVQSQSEADWKKSIVEGTGKMKPVKTLNAAEIDNVLAFMRTLKK